MGLPLITLLLFFSLRLAFAFLYHHNVVNYQENCSLKKGTLTFEASLNKDDDEVHCSWKKYAASMNGGTLMAVLKLSTAEIAGGRMVLPNGTILDFDGSLVFLELKNFLNLTIRFVYSRDWDESWKMVETGNVELGTPLRTTNARLGSFKSIALLYPLLSMSSNVYFRPPSAHASTMRNLIFRPIEHEAWLVLLALWSICVFACYTIQNVRNRYNLQTDSPVMEDQQILLSDILLWAVAIVSGKDYPVFRKKLRASKVSTSLQIAILTAMCLSVIILAVYTAKIIVFLSMKNTIIKTPEDLLKYKYTLSSYSTVHMERIFKDVRNKPYIIEQAVNNFHGGDDAMKKLLGVGTSDPRFAFLTHADGFYMHAQGQGKLYDGIATSKELCGVSSFSSSIKSPRSMYIKKGSKFREILNWKILQIAEAGITFRYQLSYTKRFEVTCYQAKQPFVELSIQQISSLFSLFLTGAILAIPIYFIEWIYHKLKGKI